MPKPPRVIVVDDDASILDALAEYLRRHGFEVRTASNAQALDTLLGSEHPDVLVLDWMMPGEDGLSICRRLQQTGIPILMLSAMAQSSDRVIGLEMGADDYLAKPFDPRELLARLRALLRRRDRIRADAEAEEPERELSFAGWRFWPGQRRLLSPDQTEVTLTFGEHALLQALVARPGRILSRDLLIQLIHGDDNNSFDRAIDLAVSRLRRKLAQAHAGGDALIQTLRGEGYRFAPPVERA